MTDRVHHLNCGSMRPPAARLPRVMPSELVAHCLLVETGDRLVLVDTGFGTDDVAEGAARLGRPFVTMTGVRFDPARTAVAQLSATGRTAAEVTDIVVTHLDLDHAGGLSDFPHARVHVHRAELEAAQHPSWQERARYVPAQWAHGPRWVEHGDGRDAGERWFGFAAVQLVADDVLLVPLPGHTRGHCAVAVRRPAGGWLLHAGDAYFAAGDKRTPRSCPPGLRAFQVATGIDNPARRANLARLQELHARYSDEVTVFCAHDRSEFEALAGSQA